MTRRIVLCLSHSIEEHDQLKLLSEIGHDVFSIGGYINPGAPHDDKRPALPQVKHFPELQAAVDALGTDDNLGAAQSGIPDAVLGWADTIIFHHYLDRLYGQWPRIHDWLRGDSNRRVIWRSVGQSVDGNEADALGRGPNFSGTNFRAQGLERVAYSPKEQNIPGYSGHDAIIRFYKDPDEWKGWTGEIPVVTNFTQHLRQRDPYTNWGFWEHATKGLARLPAGPGSEAIGGVGALSPEQMLEMLQKYRVYLYTGTQPASYTLGLIEAMMTGIPVVSIGPSHMRIFPYGPDLFEGHEIVGQTEENGWNYANELVEARGALELYLISPLDAELMGGLMRERAIDLFGKDKIKAEWAAYLA